LRDFFTSGLRGNLPIFIKNFLHTRTFRVCVGDKFSNPLTQSMGVPQGSILSPTLFNLKVNSIVNSIIPNVACSLYVDDFAIYTSSHCFRTIEQRLDNLFNWCYENGFKFSKDKTVLMHFNCFDDFPFSLF
uniref:reverse transcriptase domain-containing protein n=1 Tax=Salmonella sp. s55004 TaxID=3159675 RepID=UPI0039808867